MLTINVTPESVQTVLDRLALKMTPAAMGGMMKAIGESLAYSTGERFKTSTAPDGSRWEPNAQDTYLRYLSSPDRGKNTHKDGRLNALGARQSMDKKPLVDTRQLESSINYQIVDGGAGVIVAVNRNFGDANASVHQFGTSRAGRGHKVTIPARPFLGLSAEDERTVLDIIEAEISGQIG